MGCLGVYLGVIRGRSTQGHRQCHHLIEHADTTSVYSASIETMCCLLPFIICRKSPSVPLKLRPYGAIQICLLLLLLPSVQQRRDCYHDGLWWYADGGWRWFSVSARPISSLWHSRPRPADACRDSNVRSERCRAPVVQFIYTSLAELSKSSMETVRHQPSTSHVPYHKAQCSVRV